MKRFLLSSCLFVIVLGFNACIGADALQEKSIPPKFNVKIGDFEKEYPYVTPKESHVQIAYLNFREDRELINACANELARKIPLETEMIVILGDKANILGAQIAEIKKLDWIVMTSKESPLGSANSIRYSSITSGNKTMFLANDSAEKVRGKKVVVVDDVISTGGTMGASLNLLRCENVKILATMCAFTEETERNDFEGTKLIYLGHLNVLPITKSLNLRSSKN